MQGGFGDAMGKLSLLERGEGHARGAERRAHEPDGRAEGGPPDELVEGIKEQVLKSLIRALRNEAEGPRVTGESFGRDRAEAWAAGGLDYYEEVRRFEVALITWALERTNGHQTAAAKLLGMSVSTLNMKVKQFQIPVVRTTPLRQA